ncbi:Cytochrome P450 4C1 [Frankliniella fusca]|uniref:Cytochrome P450 4C1 n=1 Tax=Frankliniella fusca TaxID=407009 RepID=A0AAE1I429_9NEOP|nr:Cytochrome P450 4C1 [Frankliniella fusca]
MTIPVSVQALPPSSDRVPFFSLAATMHVVIVLMGVVALLFVSILAIKRKIFVDRVNTLPGPPGLPVLGNLIDLAGFNFEIVAAGLSFTVDYPQIFRVWVGPFPYVILNTAETVEAVLSSVHHIDKSSDYSTLHPWLRFGLVTSTGAKWHARRRLLTPTFHFRILDQFLPVFNRNTAVLAKHLAAKEGSTPFNLDRYVHLCALDTICETAMGATLGAQENGDSEYVRALKTRTCERVFLPLANLYPLAVTQRLQHRIREGHQALAVPQRHVLRVANRLVLRAGPQGSARPLTSRECRQRCSTHLMHCSVNQVIKKRKDMHTEKLVKLQETTEDGAKLRVAFLDQLLLANENGAGLSDVDIQEEVDTFMFGGHDSVGTAVTFILYSLSKNPEIQELAYQDIISIVGREIRDLSNQDLVQMKYLERVIKEGLRLYPSVPLFIRKLHTDLQLPEVNGKRMTVPPGVAVIIAPYILHRQASLWPNPERFDPDRFLPEECATRHPYAYVPFSGGPRNCIGQKYAMMEMKCMIARLLMEFKFIEAYPGYEPEVVGELILKSKNGQVLVRLQRREHQ